MEANIAKYLPSCYTLKEDTDIKGEFLEEKNVVTEKQITGGILDVRRKTRLMQSHRY